MPTPGRTGTVTFPEWGKVSVAELNMTECSFQKNAEAVLLLDRAHMEFSRSNPYITAGTFHVTTFHFQRYKIFSAKGAHRADFKFTTNTAVKEEIKNLHVVCYNLVSGAVKTTELPEGAIHKTELSKYQQQISFSVPEVREGSVFELAYDQDQVVGFTLPQWNFNSDIPCATSSITVDFLDAITYYADQHVLRGKLEIGISPFSSHINLGSYYQDFRGSSVTYTMHDLKGYQAEPYTNSMANYTNWIGFQLKGFKYPLNDRADVINNFPSLTSYLMNDIHFGENITGPGIPKKEWKPLIADSMTAENKARAIYEFVRSNMKWNGVFQFSSKKSNDKIWKDKTGSNAEANMLLINTLRAAGLKVYPMLVVSRSRDYVNKSYPILSQYIGLDALVDFGAGREIVLDATTKYLPFGSPAYDQLNTAGLVIRASGDYYWHDIKDETGVRETTSISGEIDESGHMTGEVTIVDEGYAASMLIADKIYNKEAGATEWLKTQIPNATIESVKDSVDIPRCRMYHKVKYAAQAPTDNDGNIYLSIAAVYGTTENSFMSPERTSDIDFGYKIKRNVTMQIKIPANMTVDSLLPSALVNMDSAIIFSYGADEVSQTVVMSQRLVFLSSFYPVGIYPAFYTFFQKYSALRQRPVVLKKKA